MSNSNAAVLEILKDAYGFSPGQGFVDTYLGGVRFFWATETIDRESLIYDAGIVLIAQGRKTGFLSNDVFHYDPDNYLVLSIPIPFDCAVTASPEEPLLGVFIDINLSDLHELVILIRDHDRLEGLSPTSTSRGVEPVEMDRDMRLAAERLLQVLCSQMDSEAIGQLLVKEILYRALIGPHGPALYALTQHHTHYERIARTVAKIRKEYDKPLSVEALAREAGMSSSVFHRAFKRVTGNSPLQYIKKTRLHRARGMIAGEGAGVSEAAIRVGYGSATQFSREFKRFFNETPSELKNTGYRPFEK